MIDRRQFLAAAAMAIASPIVALTQPYDFHIVFLSSFVGEDPVEALPRVRVRTGEPAIAPVIDRWVQIVTWAVVPYADAPVTYTWLMPHGAKTLYPGDSVEFDLEVTHDDLRSLHTGVSEELNRCTTR